ncbi:MAG: fused response regulator/phosphatase [Myxococcus sp.]|nr:fused response regulator/phosphatase [Myxococcus sp.]
MDAPKRILVIDDADDVRLLVERQLEHLGYQATSARNGVEGLEQVAASRPDLVICDLRMPHLDGLGVLKVLHERDPMLPVVVMSGEGLLDDAVNALRLGAWDYLTKPIASMAVLKLTVTKALEKAELLRVNQRQREKLEVLYRELAEDQDAGRRLQQALLPENGRRLGSFVLTRELLPSSYLSGDFLDTFTLDAKHWGFYLADVAGHGVPSALVTVMLRTLVDRQVMAAHGTVAAALEPSRFLTELNGALLRQGHQKHVALFYGLIDEEKNELRCANAGCFPYPVLCGQQRALTLELPSMPLGLMPTATYEERRFELAPDATLLACTDGVFEVMGPGSLDEKSARIAHAAATAPSAAAFVERLGLGVLGVRADDVAVMMLKREVPDALRTP